MMKIGINGFGRIGRHTFRNIFTRYKSGEIKKEEIQIVGINDLADAQTLAHLLKYDSIHGPFPAEISIKGQFLQVDDLSIKLFQFSKPSDIPWEEVSADTILECTGKFTNEIGASMHLHDTVKQVIISAPSTDKSIPTIVLGINEKEIDLHAPILSNASCTTNNVAPLVKILDENWGIIDGYITTVHSMTGDQNLHDAPHKDLRRARAASSSIIPTTTGAAKAITHVFPHLEGRLGGAGIRVPVLNGSLTDFTCNLKTKTTVEEINKAFLNASNHELQGILHYTEDPIVSMDIINNPYSCVFDSQLTSIVGGLVKVVGWYDNEFGYSNRLVDLVALIQKKRN